MRQLTEIIVHCSATQANWMAGAGTDRKVREIDAWHRGNGWNGIGYHLLIDRDGTVANGRPIERVGAHVKGHNTGTIGVCLIGGFGSSAKDDPSDHFTIAQMKALRAVIADLRHQYPTISKVSGHNEYAAKACPGFSVPGWYDGHVAPTPPDVEPAAPKGGWVTDLMVALARIFGGKK